MNAPLTVQFLKFFHTIKHLRFKQIIYRLYYRYFKIKSFAASDFNRRSAYNFTKFPKWNFSHFTENHQFEFMEIRAPVEWSNTINPKLWQYNLHYFEHLVSAHNMPVSFDIDLINDWIRHNPPFEGCGWEPYTLSLRIVNFIKWFQQQPALEDDWLNSLALQAHALSQQLEYHILANHLFVNGKALVFAGAFLEGEHAERWLALGLNILDQEVKEQFLSDGAHFELSPMYHASLLWDMCDLVNLASHAELPTLKAYLPNWKRIVEKAIGWLRDLQHPDGGIPFFNDAAFGIAPTLKDIEIYAGTLGCLRGDDKHDCVNICAKQHSESGYATINLGRECKALLNLAEVKPAYQPGHTHADTLSFELSLFGQRVFVNSGTSQYGESSERHRQRSTAAHNTVEVDGESSSEVWGGFRVARRAHVIIEAFESTEGRVKIRANHDGYNRLNGKNLHAREWIALNNELQITDLITGPYSQATARFFVHPEAVVTQEGDQLKITLPQHQLITVRIKGAKKIDILNSTWHPEFGKSIPNQCIIAELSSNVLTTCILW